ncbi:hypothetical protein TorRG33x02_103650, partial [Trema orientale]
SEAPAFSTSHHKNTNPRQQIISETANDVHSQDNKNFHYPSIAFFIQHKPHKIASSYKLYFALLSTSQVSTTPLFKTHPDIYTS